MCCETPKNAAVDRCDKRIRAPDGGQMKCGRAKAPTPEGQLPWNWSCTPKCPNGKGMYRATGDSYLCNAQGWAEISFQQRSFQMEDYDDSTPTLPLPDCADRKTILGVKETLQVVYVSTMEPALLESMIEMEGTEEAADSVIPQALYDTISSECSARTKGTNIKFGVDYSVALGNMSGRRNKQRREATFVNAQDYEAEPEIDEETEEEDTTITVVLNSMNAAQENQMMFDVGLAGLPDIEIAETEINEQKSATVGIPFTVNINLSYNVKNLKNIDWFTQELTRQNMRDCVGSILSQFESTTATDEALESAGITVPSQYTAPVDMDQAFWPFWDRDGSGCMEGTVLMGGTVQEILECQACPRGTVLVSRQRGTRQMCRPCPSGSFMEREGAVANDKGELGECNACSSPSMMTNVFPAYSKSSCVKTSCFPNRTKFQVVFALDSSGSVTRPDYIRMREFAKTIVNRMCINNSHDSGSKSCGQASYVVYNSSPESYMKFKQVESAFEFSKIDNYEYRGGPARIGDLFEFIHGTFIDTEQLKTGLPLNVVLISDGQTQNDDRETQEKWTRILKKKVTKIITLSKRSIYNGNINQVASTLEDQYLMHDYHELPSFVLPVMEKLCQSIDEHKEQRNRN